MAKPPGKKPNLVSLRTPDARVSALGIARETARDIERGVYAPGARLREQELADKFRCSRAPVREALRILESQGSVVIEPMKGARVAQIGDAEFYEVFLIRRALAGMMVQEIAKSALGPAKQEFLTKARALERLAETCPDGQAFGTELRRIIRALIAAADTPRTVQLVKSLTFGHEAFQERIVDHKESRRINAQLWREIADACEGGDLHKARSAMESLFDYSFERVAGRLDSLRATAAD